MGYILVASIILINVANQFINKKFSMRYADNFPSLYAFGLLWTTLATIFYGIWLCVQGEGFSVSFGEFALCAVAGIGMVLANFFFNVSYREGPVSIVMMFLTASAAMMCVLGPILFKEPMHLKQGIGVAVLFISMFVLIGGKKSEDKISKKFLIVAFTGLVFNTLIMAAQKGKSMFFAETSVAKFCFYMLLWSAIINLIFVLFFKATHKPQKQITVVEFILPAVGVGVCICVINQLTIAAASMLSAAVQFPIQSGSSLVLATVFSAIFFGEKLGIKKIVCIAAAIVSFILIA